MAKKRVNTIVVVAICFLSLVALVLLISFFMRDDVRLSVAQPPVQGTSSCSWEVCDDDWFFPDCESNSNTCAQTCAQERWCMLCCNVYEANGAPDGSLIQCQNACIAAFAVVK